MLGVSLAEPYVFLKAVFPQWNGESASSNGAFVVVTFDAPQAPADLGPLVKVEIFDPNAPTLPQ